MAEFELILLLLGGLVAVLGRARFPAIRLPVSWFASVVLVRLAVVAPQALTFLSWQPWFLTAAIAGLVGAFVTLVLMYHWVLQGNVLMLVPEIPPLFHVFLPGIVLSGTSTGSLSGPLWIFLLLVLNSLLVLLLLFAWMRMSGVRQAKQAQNNSGTGSAS